MKKRWSWRIVARRSHEEFACWTSPPPPSTNPLPHRRAGACPPPGVPCSESFLPASRFHASPPRRGERCLNVRSGAVGISARPPACPGLLLLYAVVFGIILVLRAQARRRALRCPLVKKTCRATGKAKLRWGRTNRLTDSAAHPPRLSLLLGAPSARQTSRPRPSAATSPTLYY
jgi:hypothetical protein